MTRAAFVKAKPLPVGKIDKIYLGLVVTSPERLDRIMRFSEFGNIEGGQDSLDFVDVPLTRDIPVFIDPFALATTGTEWCRQSHALVSRFFQSVVNGLRSGDRSGALKLLTPCLVEDNRTRMGYSRGKPRGAGFGPSRAGEFLESLSASDAFKTGTIEDIEDAALFIDRIGLDSVSDLTAAVLRGRLADYTAGQCDLLGVERPLEDFLDIWSPETGWVREKRFLPARNGDSVFLVPRSIVRGQLALTASKFLTVVFDEADKGDRNAVQSLVRLLQTIPMKTNGKIDRKQARNALESERLKPNAASMAHDAPDAFKRYKNRARQDRRVLDAGELDFLNPEKLSAERQTEIENHSASRANFSANLRELQAGMAIDLLRPLYPLLQHPRQEQLANARKEVVALRFSDATKGGDLSGLNPYGGGGAADLLVIGHRGVVDGNLLGLVDYKFLLRDPSISRILLLGDEVDASLQGGLAGLAAGGLAIRSSSELADLRKVQGNLDLTFEAMKNFFYVA